MFGFIRPVKPELRIKEAERFQQVYCGLCHTIQTRYGMFYSLFLSYDMTFLALIYGCGQEHTTSPCRCRCVAHPFFRRPCAAPDASLERAADISVLLSYHKLQDSAQDEKGIKRWMARGLCWLGQRGYRKARTRLPIEDREMVQALTDLHTLEAANCAIMDQAADASARLTAAVVPHTGDGQERVLRQMFYHVGRWLYLLDAAQDLAEDMQQGNYNPIVRRYALQTPELSGIAIPLTRTLERSLIDVCTAYDLLEKRRDADLIGNIIFLGMPLATKQVLEGTYHKKGWGKHGSL